MCSQPLPKTVVVLTKNGENDDLHSTPTKTRGCAPQSPETDENDENGGCPSDKTRVYQKQGFRHPEICSFGNFFQVFIVLCFWGLCVC